MSILISSQFVMKLDAQLRLKGVNRDITHGTESKVTKIFSVLVTNVLRDHLYKFFVAFFSNVLSRLRKKMNNVGKRRFQVQKHVDRLQRMKPM